MIKKSYFSTIFFFLITYIFAQPANDACASATVVNTSSFTQTMDASATTNNAGFITACNDHMNDGVWYVVTTNNAGSLSISLSNLGNWDAKIGVYTGTCGQLVCSGTVDSTGTGGGENLSIMAQAATTYYINIGHYSGVENKPEGIFTIHIATPIANDACAYATLINTSPFTQTIDATSATNNEGPINVCNDDMNDGVWYVVTTNNAGLLNISITNLSSWDAQIGVYTGTCGNLVCAGTVDSADIGGGESIAITAQASTTYYINIGHINSVEDRPEGIFTINITTPIATPPANDACVNAIEISAFPYSHTLDASNATNNDGSILTCIDGMNDGVWYKFTALISGSASVLVSNVGNWDPEIGVYTGSCNNFTCVGNADNGHVVGVNETLNFSVLLGNTYYINIGQFGTSDHPEGSFTITVNAPQEPASVPNYVPTNGLRAWYPFSGNVNDTSGNNLNGTNNGATFTTDRNGNADSACHFNNTNITIPNSGNIDFSQGFTLAAWVNTEEDRYASIIDKFPNCGTNYGFRLNGRLGGSFWAEKGCYGSGTFTFSTAVPLNTWHHVVAIIGTDNVIKIYLDGVLSGENPTGSMNLANSEIFNIGSGRGVEYFVGKIDDVGIWNRALNQSEITTLYQSIQMGIEDNFEVNEFSIFPNPAGNFLNILNKNAKKIEELSMIDITGKIVTAFNFNNNYSNEKMTIDIPQSLKSGFYLLKIKVENNTQFIKFFKQ